MTDITEAMDERRIEAIQKSDRVFHDMDLARLFKAVRAIRLSDEAANCVLVPKEATDEMSERGARIIQMAIHAPPSVKAKLTYRDMLAASPFAAQRGEE